MSLINTISSWLEKPQKLNVVNINLVANAIETESLPLVLDMTTYGYYKWNQGCHACIAGHTVALFKAKTFNSYVARNGNYTSVSITSLAKEYLGIDEKTASHLFYGKCPSDKEIVVAVLRHLAKTGKVNWNIPISKELPKEFTDILQDVLVSGASTETLEKV